MDRQGKGGRGIGPMGRLGLGAMAAVLLVLPQPMLAQRVDDTATYTVSILGLPAAQLAIALRREGAAYAAAMQVRSAGLAGLFSRFTVDSSARGTIRNGRWHPTRYKSTSDGERGGRGAEMVFNAGVPEIISLSADDDPTAPPVDPARQRGTVDPLTAILAVSADLPADQLCQQKVRIFDGHRVAQMVLSGPIKAGTTCRGVYQRLEGYPPEELAQRDRFDFELDYVARPEGQMRMTELRLDSLFGLARLRRIDD